MPAIKEAKFRELVKRYLVEKKLVEQSDTENADQDLDIGELEGLNLPPVLKKLLDPDISPQQYAKIDQMVDAGGNQKHQAFAIAAFVLSYADMDENTSTKILNLAKGLLPKIIKARQKGVASEAE